MDQTLQSQMTMSDARILLGWMGGDEALRVQHECRADVEFHADAAERFHTARRRVAARPTGVDQRGAVLPAPPELEAYMEALTEKHASAGQRIEAWTASLVDLRRLCAIQPRVFTDRADELVRAVDPNDLPSIAAVSLPAPGGKDFPALFDPARGAWVLTSADPNLRVVGNIRQPAHDGIAGFGFAVTHVHSCLSAVEHCGRYYLVDGYHRAFSFLRHGITHVPALTRTLADDEPFTPPMGMLPASAYLGERPPLLADFLDDDVSMPVRLPVFRKIILIQAIEVLA